MNNEVSIRAVGLEDAPMIRDMMAAPDFKKYIGERNVHTIADAEAYIEAKMLKQYRERGYGNFVMEYKGQWAGTIGLFFRSPEATMPDIGFSLLHTYYGKSIARRAAELLIERAFNIYGLEALTAYTSEDNHRSQGLINRLGFTYTNNEPLADQPDGQALRRYELLKADWLAQKDS